MDWIMSAWEYLRHNWEGILIAGGALLAAAETITRLTPTEKDDGFVKRLGEIYAKLFDILRVPNLKKKDGSFVIPAGTHKKQKDE